VVEADADGDHAQEALKTAMTAFGNEFGLEVDPRFGRVEHKLSAGSRMMTTLSGQ